MLRRKMKEELKILRLFSAADRAVIELSVTNGFSTDRGASCTERTGKNGEEQDL